jgi:hypothetical protein
VRADVPAQEHRSEHAVAQHDVATLLDPVDVQRTLKLSSRRGARELIVREMEHVLIGRTPMTTAAWLAQWLERQRRAPRSRFSRPQPHLTPIGVAKRGRSSRSRSAIPPARRRAKGA